MPPPSIKLTAYLDNEEKSHNYNVSVGSIIEAAKEIVIASRRAYFRIKVEFNEGVYHYDDLLPGQHSEYRTEKFESAFDPLIMDRIQFHVRAINLAIDHKKEVGLDEELVDQLQAVGFSPSDSFLIHQTADEILSLPQ